MNPLRVGLNRFLLVIVVAVALSLSVGVDCGPAAEVEFGYNYEHVTPPQWTPDGKHVVLSRYGAITVAALDGSGSFWRIHEVLDRLNDRSVRFDDSYAPNVSPDGTEVAYMHRYTRDDLARDLNYEIHVASLDGSNIRRLSENDYHEASPVWSPDNTRIAYWSSSLESPAWALMTMAKDGTDKRHVITIDRGDPPPVVWSPDGRRLAFVQFHRSVDVLEYAIHVVGEDGSNPTRLAPTSSSPLWSHDGSSIFFVHAQEDADSDDISTALYSIRPDGTDLRNVADIQNYRPPFEGNLDWSTDGSEIGYYSASHIISIKVDGSSVSRLKAGLYAGNTRSARSPDGTTVAVGVTRPEGLGEDKDVYLFLMAPDGSYQRAALWGTGEGTDYPNVSAQALRLLVGKEGIIPRQLIDWELTQYTPHEEEQGEGTGAGSNLTSAACSDTEETCQSRDVTQTVWPPKLGGGAPPPSF